MTVERPEEEEIHLLFRKFSKPVVREFRIDLRERDEEQDYPPCKAGTRIVIKEGEGIVMVRGPEGEEFGIPGGRIGVDESVEEGAIREAKEETGLDVDLKRLSEMHKCQYIFKNWNLERWTFVFVAEAVGGTLTPADPNEIAEVAIFGRPPPYYGESHWLRSVWNECLSLGRG